MDFSLFLLVTLLLSSQTHARESRFFNKASPTTTTTTTTSAANAVAESNQPKFVQDDGNTYGLYAHDSSTAAVVEKPLHDYFPNNYNQAAALEDANEAAFPKRNTYYNGGGGGFNIRPQRQFGGGFDQPQGMSDTRFLENGKYFYDVNTERYVSNHPYQVMRGDRRRNEDYNKNFDGGGGGGYGFNGGRYQNNLDVFDDEVDNLP